MSRKFVAEFIGTAWLVLGGCGSAVLAAAFPQLGIGFVGVALAFGLTVLTMAAALGLGGRSRKLGDPSERARKAVAARIRDAIERIAIEHVELGRHLRASVNTGTFCSYAPPSPTSWRVTQDTAR